MEWEQAKTVLTLAGTFLLMILVFAGAYWCSKLVAGGARRAGGAPGRLEVVDRVPLGKDSALVVVRAGERLLLLGVTSQQVRKLEELDASLYPEGAGPSPDFAACLKAAWKEKLGKGEGPRP